MLMPKSADYDALKKTARTLEAELNQRLPANAPAGQTLAPGQYEELEGLLTRWSDALDGLEASKVDTPAARTTAALMRLDRQREILRTFQRRLRALSTRQMDQERADLFGGQPRADRRVNGQQDGAEMEMLMGERSRIDNSSVLLDVATDNALAVRDDLYRQRSLLERSTSRITDATGLLPSMEDIIRRVNSRRRRDMIILTIVLSVCIILFFIYGLGA